MSVSVVASLCMAATALIGAPAAPAATTTPTCTPAKQLGLVFIIDDSGSMASNDPQVLRGQAVSIATELVRPGTVIAASKFSSTATELVAPTAASDTANAGISSAVTSGLVASGGTGFNNAFLEAKRQLAAMPTTVDVKRVIFLSDGAPNDPTYTADRGLGVPIDTVGLGQPSDTEMGGIATRSGGTYTKVASASDLVPLFSKMVSDITCDTPIATPPPTTVQPGRTWSVPFTTGIAVQEVIGSASYTHGSVSMTITRPDGTVMSASALNVGEKLTEQKWFSTFNLVKPVRGTWSINFTATGTVPTDVVVRISQRGATRKLDCTTVKTVRTGRSIDVSYQRSADPRVLYTITWSTSGLTQSLANTSSPTTISQNIDNGAPVAITVSTKIKTIDIGIPCTVVVAMPAVPVTTGTAANDTLTGIDFRDIIKGLDGDDVLSAMGANDIVWGGNGNDAVDGGDGNDKLWGENGNDQLIGGNGADYLDGGTLGDDTIDGGAGNDTIWGYAGNDVITGGTGVDTVTAGPGNDTIDATEVGTYKDTISCGPGNDTVTADKGKDVVMTDCEHVTWK